MRGDHADAAGEGDGYFIGVAGEMVAGVGGVVDAGEAGCHQAKDTDAAVCAEASEKGDGAEKGDEESQAAMHALLGGE